MPITNTTTLYNLFTFWPKKIESRLLECEQKNEKQYNFLFLVLFLFAAITNTIFLNNELWQDELYTLDNFVLVPLTTTLTDYHSTNNHIVFNFISNLYLKTINVNNLSQLLNHPFVIRIIPYSITIISIPVFYYSTKLIQGSLFAVITLAIYVSSLQVYTFGSQVRGYSLDILLSVVIVNSILLYQQHPKNKYLLSAFLSEFLLLINLPASLYFIAALIMLTLLEPFFYFNKKTRKQLTQSKEFKLFIILSIALFLAGIFYLTKLNQLEQNKLLLNTGQSLIGALKQPFSVVYRLLDYRYFLLVPFFIVIFRFHFLQNSISIFLAGAFFLPFVLFLFHNPVIILRIWVILLPLFCLIFSQFCISILLYKQKLLIPFIISLLLTVVVSLYFLKKQTLKNNASNYAPLDLRYQYHLFSFNPNIVIKQVINSQKSRLASVLLYDQNLSGIDYYLKYNNIEYDIVDKPQKEILLISDNSNCFDTLNIAKALIIDSGKKNSNNFYKWYLIKAANNK